MEREPGGDQCSDDDEETKISETEVLFFEVRDLGLAGLLALLVLVGRRRCEGLHRGIIAYRLERFRLVRWGRYDKKWQESIRFGRLLPCPMKDAMVRRGTSVRIEGCARPARC